MHDTNVIVFIFKHCSVCRFQNGFDFDTNHLKHYHLIYICCIIYFLIDNGKLRGQHNFYLKNLKQCFYDGTLYVSSPLLDSFALAY